MRPTLRTSLCSLAAVPCADPAAAQTITELINMSGAGAGATYDGSFAIKLDAAGNAFVTGYDSDNAFKITPAGVITEIIDATGDGAGNTLDGSSGIDVDAAGNVDLTDQLSRNAFKITPAGVVTESLDSSVGLFGGRGLTVDSSGSVFVCGFYTDNAFKIELPGPSVIATSDCGPVVPNSTGASGSCSAIGFRQVAANNVALLARDLMWMGLAGPR